MAHPAQPAAVRALVLARGRGTRMREPDPAAVLTPEQAAAADAGQKGMMPFFGRPFLDHVLSRLADAGIREAALVIGPEHDTIREYYTTVATRRLRIALVTQHEPLGTADAVASASDWIGRHPFIVLNADNLYPLDVLARLVSTQGPAVPGFEAASLRLPAVRLGTFALLEGDARGCLARIHEKPGEEAIVAAGPTALISMNIWRFDERILDYCRRVPLSERGERELPQAAGLAARAMCIAMFPVRGEVPDLSRRADVAVLARELDGRSVAL